MKKTKIVLLIVLILVLNFIIFANQNVFAHSIELDPNSLIGFPLKLYDGEGKITISSSQTGYTLYYQSVQISNENFEKINKNAEDGKVVVDAIKTQMNTLKAEYNNLQEIYKEARDTYQEKINNGITGTELETAKTAYETAKTNYENKVKEYNAKVEEHNAKVEEINNKEKELIPSYVEGNWKKTEDRSFSIDLTQFSGKKSFVVWAKLISSDGTTSYDTALYTMDGTKEQEVKVTGINLDKNEVSLKEGATYTLVVTIAPINATNKSITWTSDNEKVAKVENGKITAVSVGIATITATTKDGNYTASCKVTVTKEVVAPEEKPDTTVPVTSVTLDKKELALIEGNTSEITATIAPTNATNKSITWTSDNEKVAKVENGKITAVSAGEVTITVTTSDGKHTASCKVTVNKKVVPPVVENKDENKQDTTQATGKLPQTGDLVYKIVVVAIILSVVGIIMYKKFKYLDF